MKPGQFLLAQQLLSFSLQYHEIAKGRHLEMWFQLLECLLIEYLLHRP
jgi:hypothetical protein